MKRTTLLLNIILFLLVGFGIFQLGIWKGEKNAWIDSHPDTKESIISPNDFAIIVSISSKSSFEVRDSSHRKEYLVYGDQAKSEVCFLEKSFDERYYLTSWTTYPDGLIKSAVNGNENSFLIYKGMGEFIAYRSKGDEKTAIYGRDLDTIVDEFNNRTKKVLLLLPKEWGYSITAPKEKLTRYVYS